MPEAKTPAAPAPESNLKLVGITFYEAPRVPGVRPGALSSINVEEPHAHLRGWRVIVRPQSIIFVSPPGWATGNADRPQARDPKGPMKIFEVPRSTVVLDWLGGDEAALEALSRKDCRFEAMLGKPVAVPVDSDKPILSQIPPGQMGDA